MKRLTIVVIVLMASTAVFAQTSDFPETPGTTVEATPVLNPEPEPTEPEQQLTPESKPTDPKPTKPDPDTTLEQEPEPTPLLETTAEPVKTSELFSTFEDTTPSPTVIETQRPEFLGYPTDASDPGSEEGEEKEEEEQSEEDVTEKKKYFENEEENTDDYNFTDDSVASSTNSISYVLAVFCLIF